MERMFSFLGLSLRHPEGLSFTGLRSEFLRSALSRHHVRMPLVVVDEESRTRPPMPRQKNVSRGHDCSRIVGSQKLLH